MKWYIGQRIVAVANHSQGHFREGDEFNIKGLRGSICNCNGAKLWIDVGNRSTRSVVRCIICDKSQITHGVLWYKETCFAPLYTRPELSELTDEMILTEPTTKELQTA